MDTLVIENLRPLVDGGRYPVKRAAGESLEVTADIFKDGHEVLRAVVRWRPLGTEAWSEVPMLPLGNDAWTGTIPVLAEGLVEYTIEAWPDAFASWVEEITKKQAGGQEDLRSEALEGAALLSAAAERTRQADEAALLQRWAAELSSAGAAAAVALARRSDVAALLARLPDRSAATVHAPAARVLVERPRALFAAWYEFFPRSAEGRPDAGSTFRQALGRVDDAKAMGFDVIYFPPIHPIGRTKRKGRNNALTAGPDDPGVPYAIGNRHQGCPHGGGHKDVAPELGTLEDFRWLVGEVRARGMEIALDFALNCSPDHPYVHDHPEWFFHRPDGTIKYAENPPKKYEDVYPLNFHTADREALWQELLSVVLFWAAQGVRILRVDNPHTKPVAFWEWLIAETRRQFPDMIFLSEAFTRPKMMQVLAKAGFSQSYTYFTWRNTRRELEEYFTELTTPPLRDFFRPNLFPNTPDILPFFLQQGGRPAFAIRAVLAATLSPLYGIYSGFELCENAALPGREEYADSEKYQFKARDWNAPGNIKPLLTALNAIRRAHPALQVLDNLHFHHAQNEHILVYSKVRRDPSDLILVAINLDPHHPQSAWVEIPPDRFGLAEDAPWEVHDLLTDERFSWQGRWNFVALDPQTRPAHVFAVRPLGGRAEDFDPGH